MTTTTTPVSLPSINEMFPEHMMRTSPPLSRQSSSPPSTQMSSSVHRRPSVGSLTSSKPYSGSFNVMRSNAAGLLEFVATKSNMSQKSPSQGANGTTPTFRVNVHPADQRNHRGSTSVLSAQDNNYRVNQQLPHNLLPRPAAFTNLTPARVTDVHISPSPYPSVISFPLSGSSSPIITSARDHKRIVGKQDSYSSGEASDQGDGKAAADCGDNTKRHVCPTCSKRFNRPSSLRIHVNTHTGATPFRCPYPNCGREFNVNSNMRRHLRNHSASGATRSHQPETDGATSRSRRKRAGSGSTEPDSPYTIGAAGSDSRGMGAPSAFSAVYSRSFTGPGIMPTLPSFASTSYVQSSPVPVSILSAPQVDDTDEESDEDDSDELMDEDDRPQNNGTSLYRLQPVTSFKDAFSLPRNSTAHHAQSDVRSLPHPERSPVSANSTSPPTSPSMSPSISSERSSYMRHSPPRENIYATARLIK